jgi:hypothetical protein
MPYIKQENRPIKDKVVEQMVESEVQVDGDLNYILFKYCKYHYPHSYNNLKNFCGELRQCATEIERKILGPYEDEKIQENGDV